VDASAATLANNTTGSAATLTTGRTISASGDATGTSAAFNGSAALTIPLTLASTITAGGPTGGAATVPVITYDAKGRLTAVSTATITPAAIGAASVASPTFTGTVTTPAFTLSGANTGLFTSTSGSMGVTSGATGTMLVGAGVGAVPTWSASPSVTGTLTSTDASALANGVVVGGNAGMGTAAASGSGAWFGPTGGNSITAGTENGVMAAPTYMDITSPGSIQAQAATTFSLAIGSVYSFTALSASTSGVTLNGTTTIGTGTGTAILTSGVVSTLSGTNLVLGNGSTIPQSTFQAAGSYLPLAAGASYPLGGQLTVQGGTGIVFSGVTEAGISTSGADGAWFSNSLSGDLNIRAKGSQTLRMGSGNGSGASVLDLNATTGAECYINFKVDGTTTLASSLTGLATLTAGVVGATVTPSVTSLTATGTGTAISAPNGDISRNGDLFASTVTSSGTAVTLTNSSAEIQVITTSGFTYTLPASPTTGRRFTFCSRGTSISINPNGKTLWSPGPSSGTGTISVTSYGYINVFFDGTVWYLDRS